jgi:tyrosinase
MQVTRWPKIILQALIGAGGNKRTIRAPNKQAETTDVDVDRYISDHIQADVGSSLYKVLTVAQEWSTFSNDGAPSEVVEARDDQGNRVSHEIFHTVEGFHDNIHGHIGNGAMRNGSGHMGDPQLAAFDPIFWFVVPSIDRLLDCHANRSIRCTGFITGK